MNKIQFNSIQFNNNNNNNNNTYPMISRFENVLNLPIRVPLLRNKLYKNK